MLNGDRMSARRSGEAPLYDMYLPVGQANYVTVIVVCDGQLLEATIQNWKRCRVDCGPEIQQVHNGIGGLLVVF